MDAPLQLETRAVSIAVYINHLERPYPRDSRASINHYVGFCNVYTPSGFRRVLWRQAAHAAGRGSRLLRAVSNAGIGWRTTRVIWNATREDEKRIKRSMNLKRYCPECNPKLRRFRLRAEYWTTQGKVG